MFILKSNEFKRSRYLLIIDISRGWIFLETMIKIKIVTIVTDLIFKRRYTVKKDKMKGEKI